MTRISLIDTHAHFNSLDMANLTDEIESANKNDRVSKIINVGLDLKTSEEAIQISLANPKFYSTLGIHPLHDDQVEGLKKLYTSYPNDKIVTIGETGFDMASNLDAQIKKFLESILLANELHLPLIIHLNTHDLATRRLYIETIKWYRPLYGFIFHYFHLSFEHPASVYIC